mgnify:CR=1 FL=1
MHTTRSRRLLAGAAMLALPALAQAQTNWTNWTAATVGAPGSASGTLAGVGAVTWTGALNGFQLANGTSQNLTERGAQGSNYWNPAAPYTNASVGLTAPDRPGFLQQNAAGRGTLTFATAVTNPVIAFVSVGQGGLRVDYTLNAGAVTPTLSVLSGNSTNAAYWGTGSVTVADNILQSNEFSGVVQLNGTFTSVDIAWGPNEFWHGFTVGQVVPEPSTYALMATGLAGLGAVARRRRRTS